MLCQLASISSLSGRSELSIYGQSRLQLNRIRGHFGSFGGGSWHAMKEGQPIGNGVMSIEPTETSPRIGQEYARVEDSCGIQ